MSIISFNDLKNQSAIQWLKVARADDIIVTSQGQPVAVLLPINETTLEPTLSAIRSVRALQAQNALQQAAETNGRSSLTNDDIDSEISAARQTRHRRM